MFLSQAVESRRFSYVSAAFFPGVATARHSGFSKKSVFLLSRKLPLEEHRLVKQFVWDIKKTESLIRLSRSGSKAARLPTTIWKRSGCPPHARGRWMREAARSPGRATDQ